MGCGVVIVPFDRPIPADTECHYCQRPFATTRDHIVPRSRLGADAWWNLVPACEKCNQKKSGDDTDCRCAFCNRAVMLFAMGHTRQTMPRQKPYYVTVADGTTVTFPPDTPHWEALPQSFEGAT